jgi:hypothetical protein
MEGWTTPMIRYNSMPVSRLELLLRLVVFLCMRLLYRRYSARILPDSGYEAMTPAGYGLSMLYSIFPDSHAEMRMHLDAMGPAYYYDKWKARK